VKWVKIRIRMEETKMVKHNELNFNKKLFQYELLWSYVLQEYDKEIMEAYGKLDKNTTLSAGDWVCVNEAIIAEAMEEQKWKMISQGQKQ